LEENVQRDDLTPLEEAEALAALAAERGHTHAELARVIHKSRPYVSNTLALTRLPQDVKQQYFRDGGGVSREVLIGIARQETPEAMRALWRRAKLQAMSVRTFRRTPETRAARGPASDVLRAARRLNKALRRFPGTGDVAAGEIASIRRALSKTARAID